MNALILACVGVAAEVAFTAIAGLHSGGGWKLAGTSYLWMFPIYALLYPGFSYARPRLQGRPAWARALVYAAAILAVEYLAGWALRLTTGACPWDYGDARWAVQGVIRLDYAPLWAAAALGYEAVFRRLRRN